MFFLSISLDQISNRYWLWHGCQVTLNSKRRCHQNAQFRGHISTFRGSSLLIWLCYCLRHTVKKHLLWQQREIVYRAHNVQNVVQFPNSLMLPTMDVLPMWSSDLNPVTLDSQNEILPDALSWHNLVRWGSYCIPLFAWNIVHNTRIIWLLCKMIVDMHMQMGQSRVWLV